MATRGIDGSATDTPSPTDTSADVNDVTALDASTTLAGVYRLTGLDVSGDGGTFHVSDIDTVIGGIHARVNGIMNLTAGSYSLSLATPVGATSSDHVPVDAQATAQGMPRLSATGFGLAEHARRRTPSIHWSNVHGSGEYADVHHQSRRDCRKRCHRGTSLHLDKESIHRSFPPPA